MSDQVAYDRVTVKSPGEPGTIERTVVDGPTPGRGRRGGDMGDSAVAASPDHHHGDHGHDSHAHGDHAAMFRRKFWVSFLLTLPAVAYSEMLHELTGFTAPSFSGDEWVAPFFGTAVFLYGGPVFLKAGWGEIKQRQHERLHDCRRFERPAAATCRPPAGGGLIVLVTVRGRGVSEPAQGRSTGGTRTTGRCV
jgi:hypothetical protein